MLQGVQVFAKKLEGRTPMAETLLLLAFHLGKGADRPEGTEHGIVAKAEGSLGLLQDFSWANPIEEELAPLGVEANAQRKHALRSGAPSKACKSLRQLASSVAPSPA